MTQSLKIIPDFPVYPVLVQPLYDKAWGHVNNSFSFYFAKPENMTLVRGEN